MNSLGNGIKSYTGGNRNLATLQRDRRIELRTRAEVDKINAPRQGP